MREAQHQGLGDSGKLLLKHLQVGENEMLRVRCYTQTLASLWKLCFGFDVYYLAYQKGQSSLQDSNWDKTDCEENSIFPLLLLTPLSSLFLLSFINLFTCDSMSCFKQQQGEVKKSIQFY